MYDTESSCCDNFCSSGDGGCAQDGNCWKRAKAKIGFTNNSCNIALFLKNSSSSTRIETGGSLYAEPGTYELWVGTLGNAKLTIQGSGIHTTTLSMSASGSTGNGTYGNYTFEAGKYYYLSTSECNSGGTTPTPTPTPTPTTYTFKVLCEAGNAGCGMVFSTSKGGGYSDFDYEELKKYRGWMCVCDYSGSITSCNIYWARATYGAMPGVSGTNARRHACGVQYNPNGYSETTPVYNDMDSSCIPNGSTNTKCEQSISWTR